jgi:sulfite reductase alpha subunit
MATIGTWRDNIRTNEKLAKEYMASHGMEKLVNDVISRCPTKALSLKSTKDVSKADGISSVAVTDTQSLEIDNHNCVRCMHCLNVMPGALLPGNDKGVTILAGGKSVLKIGATMGTVIVPFMPLKTDEDFEKLNDLARNIIDFFAENALEHERTGEMIERIGLVNFLEGLDLEIDPNMISEPRNNPYVRTDGWNEEVEKWEERKQAAS